MMFSGGLVYIVDGGCDTFDFTVTWQEEKGDKFGTRVGCGLFFEFVDTCTYTWQATWARMILHGLMLLS